MGRISTDRGQPQSGEAAGTKPKTSRELPGKALPVADCRWPSDRLTVTQSRLNRASAAPDRPLHGADVLTPALVPRCSPAATLFGVRIMQSLSECREPGGGAAGSSGWYAPARNAGRSGRIIASSGSPSYRFARRRSCTPRPHDSIRTSSPPTRRWPTTWPAATATAPPAPPTPPGVAAAPTRRDSPRPDAPGGAGRRGSGCGRT